jgi:uncharacterized protein
MVRFVVAPDGAVVPDVSERLPGRGIWLTASRSAIEKAISRQVFSKATRSAARAVPALADEVERLLARRCIETLGLARRAGGMVIGYDQVADWLSSRRVAVVLVASDAGANQRGKVLQQVGDAPVLHCLGREELGASVGRDSVAYAAVAPGGLAERLLRDGMRLAGLRDRTAAGSGKVVFEEEDKG